MNVQTAEKTYELNLSLTETEILNLIHQIDAIYPNIKPEENKELLNLKHNLALTLANY